MSKPMALASSLILAMLAGCVGGGGGDQVFTVPEDADSRQDAYTGDGYELRVRVTDLDGNPVPGAAVVYFTGGVQSIGGGGASGTAESGMDGGYASGGVFWSVSVNDYDLVAGARTDADGMASADLEPGKSVHVAAGDVAGMTTEMLQSVAVGSGGDSGTVALELFPAQRTVTFNVTADNFAGQAGIGETAYQAFAIPFAADAAADAGFHQRLHAATITMTWSNEPVQGGDLFVGLAAGDTMPFARGDDERNVAQGEQTETLTVDVGALDGQHGTIAGQKAHAAAMTDYAGGGIDGLPLTFTVDAAFKGSNIQIQ